jgi:hypothetical protein
LKSVLMSCTLSSVSISVSTSSGAMLNGGMEKVWLDPSESGNCITTQEKNVKFLEHRWYQLVMAYMHWTKCGHSQATNGMMHKLKSWRNCVS